MRALSNADLRAAVSSGISTDEESEADAALDEIMRRMEEKDTQIRALKARAETESLKKELEALKRRMHDAERMLTKKTVSARTHACMRSVTPNYHHGRKQGHKQPWIGGRAWSS